MRTVRARKVFLIFCSSLSFSKTTLPVPLLELTEWKVPTALNSYIFRQHILEVGWKAVGASGNAA